MAGTEGDDASKAAALAKGKLGEPATPPMAGLTNGSGSGEVRIIERVVRQTSSMVQLPPLTRTNYTEWALVMRVRLQAQGLWEVVEHGAVIDYRDDRVALASCAARDVALLGCEGLGEGGLGCPQDLEAGVRARPRSTGADASIGV
uniref:DUF4219 domain-containing protein n=1 Tax=Aegilops tauschii subsp. strangulata TaxID=200361 RepID=A0A453QQD9_AEGTS